MINMSITSSIDSALSTLKNQVSEAVRTIDKYVQKIDFAYTTCIILLVAGIIFLIARLMIRSSMNEKITQNQQKCEQLAKSLAKLDKKNRELTYSTYTLTEENKMLKEKIASIEGFISANNGYRPITVIKEQAQERELFDFANSYKNLSDEHKEKIMRFIEKVENEDSQQQGE